jgi:hypothetical protein
MSAAVSVEDAARLGASATWRARVASAARGEEVSEEEMRKRAVQYVQGSEGTVLPIAMDQRSPAFHPKEPLVARVVSNTGRELGRVVSGSGVVKPSGNAETDTAMHVLAGATHLEKPRSPGLVQAIQASGFSVASSNDSLSQLRGELARSSVESGPVPPAEPARTTRAQIWQKGASKQHVFRCRRAFIDREPGRVPLVVLVMSSDENVAALPQRVPLVINLVPPEDNQDPITLEAVHIGLGFRDLETQERYLCLGLQERGETHEEDRAPGVGIGDGDPDNEFGDSAL